MLGIAATAFVFTLQNTGNMLNIMQLVDKQHSGSPGWCRYIKIPIFIMICLYYNWISCTDLCF